MSPSRNPKFATDSKQLQGRNRISLLRTAYTSHIYSMFKESSQTVDNTAMQVNIPPR